MVLVGAADLAVSELAPIVAEWPVRSDTPPAELLMA